MPRVIGIDPGTVTIDVCGLEDGRVFLDQAFPTATALADPARFIGRLEAAGPLDCIAGPSGYGLPLTRAQQATEEDLRLAFLAREGEPGGIGGLGALARALARSALPVFFTPGVIHLSTVPAHRKVNRVDMGTADKVCAAALAVAQQAERGSRPIAQVSLVLLELGGAFTAVIAVGGGKIVDGVGGSSGPLGFRAAGALDGEVAFLAGSVSKAMFKPFTVSAMLDSNGSNTTAVAAVAKMVQAAGGEMRGKRVLIVAGTGPVGIRAAGLFAKAAADVCITSRKADAGERARDLVLKRFGGTVRAIAMPDAKEAIRACERAELLLNAGPAGVMLVPKQAWASRPGLKVVADVNAVPPLGIEGVEVMDDGVTKEGVVCFGALAIGNLKMKVHKACIARLFERNDLVLDAETIADVARELMAPKS